MIKFYRKREREIKEKKVVFEFVELFVYYSLLIDYAIKKERKAQITENWLNSKEKRKRKKSCFWLLKVLSLARQHPICVAIDCAVKEKKSKRRKVI